MQPYFCSMEKGKCVIFSAPSGAGKTTLVKHLMIQPELGLAFSVSATSRAKRANEVDGKDYHFVSADEFRERVEADQFVEWEEVYTDQYYGTLKSEVERIWANGKHVIFDVDVLGGINLKKIFGDAALAVFVKPPSIDALEERLRNRGSEDEESLRKRVGKAAEELKRATEFDVILINDNLEVAKSQAVDQVKNFLGE